MRVPAGARLPDALAAALLERAGTDNLAGQVVLVPSMAAAPGLRSALGRAAARLHRTALFPPRIVTLGAWAATVALPRAVERPRERLARLYGALKSREGLRGAGGWQVARALLAACDVLTQGTDPGEDSIAALRRAVREAYRGRAAQHAGFEARLVIDLWRAMTGAADAEPLDPAFAERLRLSRLVAAAAAPLWVLEHRPCGAVPGPLARFVAAYAARAPVTVLAPAWDRPHLALARAVWSGDDRLPLADRVRAIAAGASPQLIHADSLEAEADAVAAVVRAWVAAGRRDIALVALDRLAARRARALLERDGILIADEAGWRLSTTSAATALMRWLDCASADFPQGDLLDLLRSPFVFADMAPALRRAVAGAIDRVARADNLTGGLALLRRALAAADLADDLRRAVLRVLDALERGAAQLDPARGAARELRAWSDRLSASLEAIGLAAGLADDAAGAQVGALLAALADDARHAPGRLEFAEWRDWIAGALEEETFRDTRIRSSVVMTDLEALALRRFDGVVLIGADASRLPGPPAAPLFLGEGMRAALGLPDAAQRGAALRADLMHLLGANDAVAVTWRDGERGEANPLAPPLALLDAAHRIAAGTGLARRHRLPAAGVAARGTARAAPRAAPLLPRARAGSA
ncbi:MAG: hypothetical protein JNM90_21205, partial [Burkholderiales bacterium]|nr:hypothetical protein [Burkholderiales bacterium]